MDTLPNKKMIKMVFVGLFVLEVALWTVVGTSVAFPGNSHFGAAVHTGRDPDTNQIGPLNEALAPAIRTALAARRSAAAARWTGGGKFHESPLHVCPTAAAACRTGILRAVSDRSVALTARTAHHPG